MDLQPALGDRVFEAGAVFGGRPLVLIEEWAVDLLDVDPLAASAGTSE